jgi:hypothetical protein
MLEQPILPSSSSEGEDAEDGSEDDSDFEPATPNMPERPLLTVRPPKNSDGFSLRGGSVVLM